MRHEPIRRALRLDLRGSLTEGQCLGLGEHIGKQQVMMPAQWVEGPRERDEIAWNKPRALMDQLIEGMLTVRSRLTPIDRPCVVIHCDPVDCYMLAIALHGELLEISRKALQILLIRQHRDGLSTEEVVVPDAEQPHEHR